MYSNFLIKIRSGKKNYLKIELIERDETIGILLGQEKQIEEAKSHMGEEKEDLRLEN